jgi:hypothetical protein
MQVQIKANTVLNKKYAIKTRGGGGLVVSRHAFKRGTR